MPVLSKSKHEKFAQAVAKGLTATEAYASAGYSRASANSNATRLMGNEGILLRIAELKTVIAKGVVSLEIRARSARVQVLQSNLDRLRNLIESRAFVYSDYPGGGATGLLVKDYRGKNAEKEVWKFDASLLAQMNDTLKQAAIEEGQWTEKRETTGSDLQAITERLNAGRRRVAEARRALDHVAAQEPVK
jgi:hypothetical protein